MIWGKHPGKVEAERQRALAAKRLGRHYADILMDDAEPSKWEAIGRPILFTTIGGVLMAAVLLVALFFAARF
jgi:hypothetical protein